MMLDEVRPFRRGWADRGAVAVGAQARVVHPDAVEGAEDVGDGGRVLIPRGAASLLSFASI
jgi:hypothetical protein